MLCLLGFFVDNLFLLCSPLYQIIIPTSVWWSIFQDIVGILHFFSEKLKVKGLKLKNRKILKSREKSSISQSRELKQWKGGIGCHSPHWTSSCTTCHLIRKMTLQRFQWNEKQYHDGWEKNWKLLN